ncbi:MAG TPA: hypothetical protein VN783_08800, partial [Thermoanaerobaculia bacterium]|nr:hypothetical protein [Thermoanaerobaculia bacterium]
MRDDDRRALELLDLVIRTAGRTRKEVDERARLCRGTTSQLLSGRIQLKYHHILDVLAACETEPRVFFRALHDDLPAAPPSGLSLHEQMIEAARRAGLDPDLDADEPALPAMGKSPGDPGGPQIVVRLED